MMWRSCAASFDTGSGTVRTGNSAAAPRSVGRAKALPPCHGSNRPPVPARAALKPPRRKPRRSVSDIDASYALHCELGDGLNEQRVGTFCAVAIGEKWVTPELEFAD